MGLAVWFFMGNFDFPRLVFLEQLGVLLSAIIIGILIYLLMNLLFNHEELRSLRDVFSREKILKE
jgi:putative peptidoglycan lipid II flippase